MGNIRNQKFYLAISKGKWNGLNGRLTKTNCGLRTNERLLQFELSVPDSIFQIPQLQAKIEVPESAVSPPIIEAKVLENIKQIIHEQTGIELTITIVEPKKE